MFSRRHFSVVTVITRHPFRKDNNGAVSRPFHSARHDETDPFPSCCQSILHLIIRTELQTLKHFTEGFVLVFSGGQNLINYLKMSIKAGSSSGIVLPPLYHLPSCKMLQHVFPTSILFNTSRCFTLPFFMALVSVFLGQSTLVFFFC